MKIKKITRKYEEETPKSEIKMSDKQYKKQNKLQKFLGRLLGFTTEENKNEELRENLKSMFLELSAKREKISEEAVEETDKREMRPRLSFSEEELEEIDRKAEVIRKNSHVEIAENTNGSLGEIFQIESQMKNFYELLNKRTLEIAQLFSEEFKKMSGCSFKQVIEKAYLTRKNYGVFNLDGDVYSGSNKKDEYVEVTDPDDIILILPPDYLEKEKVDRLSQMVLLHKDKVLSEFNRIFVDNIYATCLLTIRDFGDEQ